jgi:hypothetical protein
VTEPCSNRRSTVRRATHALGACLLATVLAGGAVATAGLAAGCTGQVDGGGERPASARPVLEPIAAGLRALTRSQYAASVRAVLELPAEIPVDPVGQWETSVAASEGGAAAEVRSYEQAAHAIVSVVWADPALRARVVGGCTPTLAPADPCIAEVVGRIGRRAFRRSLGVAELARWTAAASTAGTLLEDADRGLSFAIAGLLQSPSFVYRVEVPDVVPGTETARYGSDALATRLAYFLWDTTPDEALLDAAARGDLLDEQLYDATVDRMIADPRVQAGIDAFVADLFEASRLSCGADDCASNPETAHLLPSFGPQLVRTAAAALEEEGFVGLFTSRTAFVDRSTAEFYGLSADDFGDTLERVELADDSVRVGALLTPGLMAALSSGDATSVSGRGLYVLSQFLCSSIPPPPEGVVAELPEAPEGLVRTRDLYTLHEVPQCASCHQWIDPIGLGLENFDGRGQYREFQNGFPVDASGVLDGVPFNDAVGLSRAIADRRDFASCMTSHVVARAAGAVASPRAAAIGEVVDASDGDFRRTLAAVAHMDAFRFAFEGDEP